ncbi:hypothetical protein JOQ06_027711 [Pogonophryne albipinna]|uniref:MICOS complex subunit MIC10 n=1 Tax=Pogonophryne albipinna TaxID=1090488 RepID=A0AAD6A9V3_9TELE|nr:hypothetical protein JOQ06_027711 [Pogonophryne albipinna]
MADVHGRKWDRCLADTAVKTVTGLGLGVLFSVVLFKRRTWPVSLGSGLGLGMGYANCQHDLRSPYLVHGSMVKAHTFIQPPGEAESVECRGMPFLDWSSVLLLTETAQQDSSLWAQPRLTPATEFYNKRQQLGKYFSVELRENLTLAERRTKGRDGFGEGARSAQRDIALCSTGCFLWAAPPAHINRLALFPDKSAWCEAKNITQIVGHTGCQPRSIQNRACLGQCFSYSVPNTFPQSTESLVHCDSCMPAESQWEVVTLDCPGSKESPHVDKLVERIFFCSCQPCIKEGSQEGGVMQLYPADNVVETPSLSDTISGAQARPLPPPDTHSHKHAHPHTDHHTLPHTSDRG